MRSASRPIRFVAVLHAILTGCMNPIDAVDPSATTTAVLVADGGVCLAQDAALADGGASDPYVQCGDACDCPGEMICTAEWNRGILYQLEALGLDDAFGHCVDPLATAHDDASAIQRDLDALQQLSESTAIGWAALDRGSIPYALPGHAELRLDRPLTFRFRVLLRGNGASFRVPNNVDALRFTGDADDSRIENFSINAFSALMSATGVGIDITRPGVQMQNVRVVGMGTGIRAVDVGANDVSNQRWSDVTVSQSDVYGFRIDGSDTNGSVFSGLSASGGNPIGIFDSARRGITVVGTHLEGNAVGLKTDDDEGLSRSTYAGVYIENSDDIQMSDLSAWITIAGGHLSARHEPSSDRIGSQRSHLVFSDVAADSVNPEDRHRIRVQIPAIQQSGGTGNMMAALEFWYQFTDCNPMTSSCSPTLDYPRWKLDRRLDVGTDEDVWEIRPGSSGASLTPFGWSSDEDGADVVPTSFREPFCGYVGTCP
jgi:hypothetical protein